MNFAPVVVLSSFFIATSYGVSAENRIVGSSHCSEVGLLEMGADYTVVLGGVARDYQVCLNSLDGHLANLQIRIDNEIGKIPGSQRSPTGSSCGFFHVPEGENMILSVTDAIGYASICRLSNDY